MKRTYSNTYFRIAKIGDNYARKGEYIKFFKNRTYLYFYPIIYLYKSF